MPKIFLLLLICVGLSCQRPNAPSEAEILIENILQKQAQHNIRKAQFYAQLPVRPMYTCKNSLYLGVNLLNKNNPFIDSLEIFPLRQCHTNITILEAIINGQKIAITQKNSLASRLSVPFRFKKIGLNWLDIKIILKNNLNMLAQIDTIVQTLPYYVRP